MSADVRSPASPAARAPGLRWLTAAPHRLFFFLASLLLLLA